MAVSYFMFDGSKTVSITQERYTSESKLPCWRYDYSGMIYALAGKNLPKNAELKSAGHDILLKWCTRDGIFSTGKIETILSEKPYNFTTKQLATIKAQKAEAARITQLESDLAHYKAVAEKLQNLVYSLQDEICDLTEGSDITWGEDNHEDSNWSDGE